MVLPCAAPQGGIAFAEAANVVAVGGELLVTVYDLQTGATRAKIARDARVRCETHACVAPLVARPGDIHVHVACGVRMRPLPR